MIDTLYRKLFTQTLDVTPNKLDAYIDTRKNVLTAEIVRSFNTNDIGFYVEQTDGTSYYIEVESSKSLPLDDVSYCEVVYRDRLRYRYGEPQTYGAQYILLTEEQYDDVEIDHRRISTPEYTVHTDFSGLDVEKKNDGDVCIELRNLSQMKELNTIVLNFANSYQNVRLRDIDSTTNNTYDIRQMKPISPAKVTVPATFDGYIQVGYSKFEVDRSDSPQTITVPAPDLLSRKNIVQSDEEIVADTRTLPVRAYQTLYEPIEKTITIGDGGDASRVTFSTDEFVESGTIIFSTSDDLGEPTIRTGTDYDYHTNIDVSPLSAPENVGVELEDDEHIHTENAYLIQGVPTQTEITIHFGEMVLMEESLRRVSVDPGETVVETVDVQYKHPIIKFKNTTAETYVISTEDGNIELPPNGNRIVPVKDGRDTVEYTVLNPESDETVVKTDTISVPESPQVIEEDIFQ